MVGFDFSNGLGLGQIFRFPSSASTKIHESLPEFGKIRAYLPSPHEPRSFVGIETCNILNSQRKMLFREDSSGKPSHFQ